jgi:23S rRNA pseudouridine2457 synthase
MLKYFTIYKPYRVVSRFSQLENKMTLGDFFMVPKDVYPVGRLDYESEGLLLLTNDTSLNHRLLQPENAHERTYWIEVEGAISLQALQDLNDGVVITVDGKKYMTRPAKTKKFDDPPVVPERNPPVRFRKYIPTTWIELSLTEGKNHQVRKMTAAVGYPTLRLIRYSIAGLDVRDMAPGNIREWTQEEIYRRLFGAG